MMRRVDDIFLAIVTIGKENTRLGEECKLPHDIQFARLDASNLEIEPLRSFID